jgi:Ca2+-binding RTX toxin-like protein
MRSPGHPKLIRGAAIPVAVLLFVLLAPGAAHGAPPSNDDFADAISVPEPLPFTDTRSTSEATIQDGEPGVADFGCGFIAATVWYTFTPSVDSIVAADTVGSDFDTIVAVWKGGGLDSLSLVGCADDSRTGLLSSVPFLAEAGVEYHVQVGGFVGQGGSLSFRLRQTTGGSIRGTVTDEVTTTPVEGICVSAIDAVFSRNSNIVVTAADGTFTVVVRPGEYIVGFFDCRRDAYVQELWDDVATDAEATEIVVVAATTTSGIDAAMAPACPGFGTSGMEQVVGTSGPDTLQGTPDRDIICGFGGDDILRGARRRDLLFGGRGADILSGGDGNDSLMGNGGNDSLFGRDGRDELEGGRRHDLCDGGPERDSARTCEVERRIESSH